MIDHILAIILVTILVLINLLFLKSIYPKGKFSIKDSILVIILIVIGSVSTVLLREYVLIKVVINLIAMIIVSMLIYNISLKRSILANLLFFGVLASIEFLAIVVFQYLIKPINFESLTNSNGAAILDVICYIIYVLIITFINIRRKGSNLSRMNTKGWIVFMLFPVITLCVITRALYLPIEAMSQSVLLTLLVFAISMLFLSILQFYLIDNVIQREIDISNKQTLLDQAEHINEMYQLLSVERETQKSRSHDYLNHLNVVLALAEKDNNSAITNYVENLIGTESESIDIIDTGNVVVNAVLNIKYQEAKKKNIVMPLIADDLTDIKISESDIVTILTNILDNAIEAAEQSEGKKIVLKITRQDANLCIDSINTYSGEGYKEITHYTSKTDAKNHGYGIANIRRTVEKNNGSCLIDNKDGLFRIVITIPM